MNLLECLEAISDPRRPQGQRYKRIPMLLIIIMSMLRNKYGYREIHRFCKLNKGVFVKLFGFKNGQIPSHVTIAHFIKETDFHSLQQAFYKWTKSYVKIEPNEWISIDGKCIASTVSNYDNSYQNFVSLVSLFCSKREQVFYVEKYENKKGNEGKTVEELLDILDLKGVIFTMDALHCKKNTTQNCKQRKSLYREGKS